ncbi:acyl-CoA N-acyltransferase [Hypomontagnella submonticulosa]|nr:acyl-CoA N-acyltransferase [Hypomontagnella submonticulosa]
MVSQGKIDVTLLSDEDIPTCFQVLSKSFGHNAPFVDIYFPNHDTPSGQAQGSKRLTAWKQSPDGSIFLKAAKRSGDGGQEQIVGLAIWTFMKEAPPAELEKAENVEEVWPDKDDREYMTRLWREYVIPRTQTINESDGKGVYVLELLAVHPDYQRLGAGTALVQWGTKAADEQRVKAVVEGTPAGRRCYEKCGFKPQIEEMRFDVGEEFKERKKPKLIFLTREPEPSTR